MPVEETDKYIRVRVRMPGDFTDGSFRTVWISKEKGINSVQGKLKKPPEGQSGSMVVQSLLFVKDKWSRADAVAWAKENGYKPKAWDYLDVNVKVCHPHEFADQMDTETKIEEETPDTQNESQNGEPESKSGRPSILEVEHKAYVGELKEVDEKERTITAFISTETVDRDGDIIRASGAQLAAYKQNPVVLWAHSYATPPIGKNLWIKKVKDKPGLLAKTKFADTQFAEEIYQLYKGGFLNAWSIGFLPRESKAIEDAERGRDITKWEMLEYSSVPVPSNPEALQLAVQKGIIGETLAKELGMENGAIKGPNTPPMEPQHDKEIVIPAPRGEEGSITLTIEPPLGKEVEVSINEVIREENDIETPEPAQPKKLTGEEIAAWKKQVRQAVIAGVREWMDYALGKVTTKEGENQDGGRKITRGRRRD